jgi:hypothetical protein
MGERRRHVGSDIVHSRMVVFSDDAPDFSISQADKDFLYQSGYDTAQQFCAAAPRAVNRFGRASPAVGRRADG